MKRIILIYMFVIFVFLPDLISGNVYNVSNSSYPSEEAYVAIDQNGEICVVWVEKISSSNHKIYYSIRRNGQWSSPKPLRSDLSAYNSLPHVSKGRNSGFICVWHDESTNQIKLSSFNTNEWSRPIVVSQTGGYHLRYPKVAAGHNKITAAWEKGNPLRPEIFTKTYYGKWGGIINVSKTASWTSKECDVYMSSTGKSYVVWREKKLINDVAHYYVMMNIDNGSGGWGNSFYVTDGNTHPYKPVVAVNDYGSIMVGYYLTDRASYYTSLKIKGDWLDPVPVGDRGDHHEHDYYYVDACAYKSSFLFIFRDVGYNIRYAVWNGSEWEDKKLTENGYTYHPSIDYSPLVGIVAAWTDRRENDVMVTIFNDETEPPEPEPNKPPVAQFVIDKEEGLYPLRVNFNAEPSYDPDGKIVKYEWTFGDGSSGTGKVITHTYKNKGVYIPVLKVTDDDGASSTNSSYTINVYGPQPPINFKYEKIENRNLFFSEYVYKITWDKNPKNKEIGSNIISYQLYRKGDNNKWQLFYTVKANEHNEVYDRTLGQNNLTYQYAVKGIDDSGRESDLTYVSTQTTLNNCRINDKEDKNK